MAKKYLKNEKGIVRAVTTNNLQLEKPLLNEFYDIEVHNRNSDKIDSAIQDIKIKVDNLELKAEKISIKDERNLYISSNVEEALSESMANLLNLREVQGELGNKIDNTILGIGNKIHTIVNDINRINFELKINNYISTDENMEHVFVFTANGDNDINLINGILGNGEVHI